MCGGIASALGLQNQQHNYIAAYHAGRILTYSLAGAAVGLIGFWFAEYLGALWVLRILSAIMLILMGLYLTAWFNGLILSEKLGAVVWKKLQPIGRRFLRPRSQYQALCLGMIWGWLPCGLVYSGVIYASTQAHWLASALTMLCFGLGTLPSMVGLSFLGQSTQKVVNGRPFRTAAGLALILYGIWALYQLA